MPFDHPFLSENRDEGLVSGRPGGSTTAAVRETQQGFNRPCRGLTPRRETARPGPSHDGEWMICGSGESHEHQEHPRERQPGPRIPVPISEQTHASASSAVSK